MDQNTIAFARRWARRYVGEHHPHGLDKSDVENMILRRLHYNKDKGERGRKAALASALNEAQNCFKSAWVEEVEKCRNWGLCPQTSTPLYISTLLHGQSHGTSNEARFMV